MKLSDNTEAMKAFHKWQHYLTVPQQDKLINACLHKDGDEFQILSGPDLTFDHAGFGTSIEGAVLDYVSAYIRTVGRA